MKKTTTVRELLAHLIETGHIKQANYRSTKKYRTAINRFADLLEREPELTDLTDASVEAFRESMGKHYAPATVVNLTCCLQTLWKAAAGMGAVPARPKRLRHYAVTRTLVGATPSGIDRKLVKSIFQFVVEFYAPLRLTRASVHTVRLYDNTLRNFTRFLQREPMLTDFRDDLLTRFMAWQKERGRSPATLNKDAGQLLAIWRFAARKRFVREWPDILMAIEPKRIPRAWSRDELARLWAACGKATGTICGIPAAGYWLALHELCWWTAERIGALRKLRWSDVDLSSGWVTVPAEFRKGGLDDKITRLPAVALAALKRIRKPERDLIFPWERGFTLLYYEYAKILKRAGLPLNAKSKFHRIRKSAASHLKAAGGDPSAMLGHRDPKVTAKYLDPAIVGTTEAADLLFTPGAAKGGSQ